MLTIATAAMPVRVCVAAAAAGGWGGASIEMIEMYAWWFATALSLATALLFATFGGSARRRDVP